MVEVMKKIVTPSKAPMHSLLHSVPLTWQRATSGPTSSEIPGHAEASQGQSPVGSLLLSPGSWCAQGSICALQKSVSPVLCEFSNQIPLASKVKFPGESQSLCQIPQLGNLLWVLELS